MKNDTNIYDIDGELIRNAGDNHRFTAEEIQERLKMYKEKLENADENDPKIPVYVSYIKNLQKYMFDLYSKMTPEEIQALLEKNNPKTTEEQIKQAIDELKKEVENEDAEPEGSDGPKNQDDFLTDGANRPETVMDEYVDFEEV